MVDNFLQQQVSTVLHKYMRSAKKKIIYKTELFVYTATSRKPCVTRTGGLERWKAHIVHMLSFLPGAHNTNSNTGSKYCKNKTKTILLILTLYTCFPFYLLPQHQLNMCKNKTNPILPILCFVIGRSVRKLYFCSNMAL